MDVSAIMISGRILFSATYYLYALGKLLLLLFCLCAVSPVRQEHDYVICGGDDLHPSANQAGCGIAKEQVPRHPSHPVSSCRNHLTVISDPLHIFPIQQNC